MREKRQLLTILLCNLFLTMTVAFFSPLEVFLSNITDFQFPFRNIWWVQLIVAVGGALALTLVMGVLPARAGQIAASVTLGLGVAAYVQAMFLNGSMVSLTGDRMEISSGQVIWNLVIWGAIILIAIAAVVWFGRRKFRGTGMAMAWLAAALVLVQAVAFVSLVATTDLSGGDKENDLSTDGEFDLAQGTNVIEFVLDTADGMYVGPMLTNYPELNESLSGWTYYPNATSTHSRTYPSIVYMLTGEKCTFDLPMEQYVAQSYENSHYLEELHDAGTDVRVYTWDPEMVADSAQAYVSNCTGFLFGQFENLDLPNLEWNLLKIGLYKSTPYALKETFAYDSAEVNRTSYRKMEMDERNYNFYDPDFWYDFRVFDKMTVNPGYRKAFRFYHLFGVHPGVNWDENMETVEVEDTEDTEFRIRALRGSFRMLESYIQDMKALGIYDDALIIVTADHGIAGRGGDGPSPEKQSAATVLMMVKYPGSDLSQPLKTDRSPVSHADIYATVEEALGVANGGYGSGKTLHDFTEGEERERLYYHSVLRSDEEGEIFLREYQVDGDAEDFSNWHRTGRWWDIVYSQNTVSAEPYDGGDI